MYAGMNKDNLILLGHLITRHQHIVVKKGAQKPLVMNLHGFFWRFVQWGFPTCWFLLQETIGFQEPLLFNERHLKKCGFHI